MTSHRSQGILPTESFLWLSYLQMSMDPMAGEKLPVDSEENNAINPGALAG